jgi:GAF domain-containing protein
MFVNYRTAHSFAEDELANLELFSNQAAVAIQNAQLYRAELHHAQALESIQATSSAVSAVLDLQELLPLVTREAARIFSAPASSLMLWDEQKERLVIRAAYGLGERYSQEQCIARATVEGLVATGGMLPRVFNIAQQPLGRPDLIAEEQLCTALVAPLVKGNDLIGILCVYSKDEPRQFRDEEVELARVFANHASIAIQNAQLYDDLNQTKELVAARTVLAWLGMASSTWRHSTDKYALTIREQAARLGQEWQELGGHTSGKVPERLDMIERLATKILDKLITPPLSSEEGVETISVNALIGERARQLWQNDPYRQALLQVDLELSDEALVRVSPEWVRRSFDILVDNAVEAVADRPVRKITIGTRPARGGAEILVSDTGPGIPEEIRAKVGLALIQKPEDARGMGFGLLIAQAIVQVYGGQIRVGSAGPEGTTMVIRLPLMKQA